MTVLIHKIICTAFSDGINIVEAAFLPKREIDYTAKCSTFYSTGGFSTQSAPTCGLPSLLMTGTTWSAAYLASSLFISVFSSCSFSFRLSPSVGRIMHEKKGFYDGPCMAIFCFCFLLTFLC